MTDEIETHQASLACPHCGERIDLVDGDYAATRLGISATLFRSWVSRGRLGSLVERRLGRLVGNVWLRADVDREVEAAQAEGIARQPGPGRPKRTT